MQIVPELSEDRIMPGYSFIVWDSQHNPKKLLRGKIISLDRKNNSCQYFNYFNNEVEEMELSKVERYYTSTEGIYVVLSNSYRTCKGAHYLGRYFNEDILDAEAAFIDNFEEIVQECNLGVDASKISRTDSGMKFFHERELIIYYHPENMVHNALEDDGGKRGEFCGIVVSTTWDTVLYLYTFNAGADWAKHKFLYGNLSEQDLTNFNISNFKFTEELFMDKYLRKYRLKKSH